MKTRLFLRKSYVVLLASLAAALSLLPGGVNAAAVETWTQTSQADFTGGTVTELDVASSPGDVKLSKNGSDYVYAFRGNNTKTFWRYDVSAGVWTVLADATYSIGNGGALVYDGGDYIYALVGNYTKYFLRYSISGNSWTSRASVSSSVYSGGALVFDGTYIYALRGNSSRYFWRYNIAMNFWSSRTNAPSNVSGGGALTYPGSEDYIYALRGQSTNFWKYSISGDSWSSLTGTPSIVGDGGALAADGGDYIYALKGSNTVTFWRYSISSNSWTPMADTPATPCVYGGGALIYDKSANLFALRGNYQPDFWEYGVSGDSWSILTSAPASVAYGGALAYKAAVYNTSGTLESSTYDTGYNADFMDISWTDYIPAYTTLRFQVAANSNNSTWNFVGPDGTAGTYYTSSGAAIWSGHDGARFIRYKAYFSTTDTLYTPVLNDISIAYTKQIVAPSAVTSPASSVEETTATLNGRVDNDGGEPCQYSFEWGVSPGGYTANISWTGSVSTGDSFNTGLTGLAQGTVYYFRAKVKNSAGVAAGSELDFLTKPEAPSSFTAAVISGTQLDLSWAKGPGAGRTLVMRKTGGYPASRTDGTQVYLDTGTGFSDTGLTPETTYYYRAWSEVTAGSLQQWSDAYASASAATGSMPAASTADATLVEETSGTLHGLVISDGGESCQYRFQYGTEPGVYTDNTAWAGSLHTGDAFTADITGLGEGTLYYYRVQLKNSVGTADGGEVVFLTKPEAPVSFMAEVLSDNEINLDWTKGAGAARTIVLRRTGDYPAGRDDGTVVYFGTDTNAYDSGLSPNTVYYYRAWSEVTEGSIQQWSDDYMSVSMATSAHPVPVTDNATLVEELTATLNGLVAYDVGEACEYRFVFGTASGGPYEFATDWTGSVTAGQSFTADLEDLFQGTGYFYRAELRNSYGAGTGEEVHFLTKPERPEDPVVSVEEVMATQITLSWIKGEGAMRTMIRRSTGDFPADRDSGVLVYFDTGTSCIDTGLDPDTVYYYRAWSQVSGSEQWSDWYQDITVETSTLTPTTTTTTTTTTVTTTTGPMSVGGRVYAVNKAEILRPWVAGAIGMIMVLGGVFYGAARLRKRKKL